MKINILAIFSAVLVACNHQKEAPETISAALKAVTETPIILDSAQLQLMHVELGKPTQQALEGGITANGKVTILAEE